jgi:hypothetical protein
MNTNSPSKTEVIEHLREHYGLSLAQVVRIMNSPTHPHELRDTFAGQALQGLLADPKPFVEEDGKTLAESYAEVAYVYADAMLAERVKK